MWSGAKMTQLWLKEGGRDSVGSWIELAQLRVCSHLSLLLLLWTDCWVQENPWPDPFQVHCQGRFLALCCGMRAL